MICKDCPHFKTYGITPSAYVHYNGFEGDTSYFEFQKKDGEVGICVFDREKEIITTSGDFCRSEICNA